MKIETVGGKRFVTVKQRGKPVTLSPEAALANVQEELAQLSEVVAVLEQSAAALTDEINQLALLGESTGTVRAELAKINQEIADAQFSARLSQQTIADLRRILNDTSTAPLLATARERIAANLAPFNLRRLTAHV